MIRFSRSHEIGSSTLFVYFVVFNVNSGEIPKFMTAVVACHILNAIAAKYDKWNSYVANMIGN